MPYNETRTRPHSGGKARRSQPRQNEQAATRTDRDELFTTTRCIDAAKCETESGDNYADAITYYESLAHFAKILSPSGLEIQTNAPVISR